MKVTRPATTHELIWIAPAAIASHVVSGAQELLAIHRDAPWRVRVSGRGEAALLGRWRERLDDCAVLGLWCSAERVPVIIPDLMDAAREQGFGRLLGPLLPEGVAAPYLVAGLRVVERVVVMRLSKVDRARPAPPSPDGVAIRPATCGDLDDIAAVDAASFDDFWRYDESTLARYVSTERGAVAVKEGHVIGYTLAIARDREGTLGRLAVVPECRGAGVGTALVCEAVAWMAHEGVRGVTLSTQAANAVSRRLYRGIGFNELDDALVVTASGPLLDRDRT
jgi:GNAT superfamily N-acetyltransferase